MDNYTQQGNKVLFVGDTQSCMPHHRMTYELKDDIQAYHLCLLLNEYIYKSIGQNNEIEND